MIDRVIVVIGLIALIAFCAVIIRFVGRYDLTIVATIGVLMAAFDLLYYSFRK